MAVITTAGITWRLVRTWPGGRARERAIKDRHEAPRLCPECSAPPRPLNTGRSAAPARHTITHPAPVAVPAPPRPSPYQRGLRMGEQFLAERAGWTAEQITASYLYITGPFHERPYHSDAGHEWFRGYTEPIARHLAQMRPAAPGELARSDRHHGAPIARGTR